MGTTRIRFVAHDFFQFVFARISPNQDNDAIFRFCSAWITRCQRAKARRFDGTRGASRVAIWNRPSGLPQRIADTLVALARKGITSDLRVGVHKDEGKFEAHAWVECGGAALNELEPRHQHFQAFDAALALLLPEPQ